MALENKKDRSDSPAVMRSIPPRTMRSFLRYCCAVFLVYTIGCDDPVKESPRWFPIAAPDDRTVVSLRPDQLSVSPLQRFWIDAMDQAGITGQDGGIPIRFGEQVLWTFGDTFLAPGKQGLTNTALVFELSTATPDVTYLVDGSGTARHILDLLLPETWETNRIWPGAGFATTDSIYIYYEVIHMEGSSDGAPSSSGVARASRGELRFERRANNLPIRPIHTVAIGDDGFIYLYGVVSSGGFDSHVTLARVAKDSVEDNDAYQIIDNRLIMDVFGQVNVTYNRHLNTWVMLHPGNPFDAPREIWRRTSPTAAGPWSEPTPIVAVPGEIGDEWRGLLYVPTIHSEFSRNSDQIEVISFCLAGETAPFLVEIEHRVPPFEKAAIP